jgi:hypothetical protein
MAAVVILIGAALPTTIAAQAIPAACRPLLDAQRKALMTPHQLYSTDGPADQSAKARADEMISVGGVSYLLDQGKWQRSPITPKEQVDQLQENIANAKAFSCKRVGAESVGGVPADVCTSHDEHTGSVGDGRHWVAKGSGLILRTDEDMDTGGGGKRHSSIRYEYANVRAPAGVR